MEHQIIVEHVRKKRKVVVATFALLILAFIENHYLNCAVAISSVGCGLGWIYAFLAAVLVLAAWHYRK